MRVKDYLLNNKVITDNMILLHPIITQEGKESINNKFEFEYGDLLMFYEDELKIQSAVNYILVKNRLKYTEIDRTLKLVIPLEYQKLITHEGSNTEDINKVVDILGGKMTTEERVISTDKTTSHSNRVEVDNDGSVNDSTKLLGNNTSGNTQEVVGTDTVDDKITNTNDNNINRIESDKNFDSVDFIEVKKIVETNTNPSTSNTLGERTTNSTTTDTATQGIEETTTKIATTTDDTLTLDTGTSTVLGGDTVEGLVSEENNSKTTDTTGILGSENFTEKEQSIEVLDRIEQYRALYSISLWDVIVEDIKKVICLNIWD